MAEAVFQLVENSNQKRLNVARRNILKITILFSDVIPLVSFAITNNKYSSYDCLSVFKASRCLYNQARSPRGTDLKVGYKVTI